MVLTKGKLEAGMADDPIVEEVRNTRARFNEESNYDLRKLAAKAAEFARSLGMTVCSLQPTVTPAAV